MVPRAPPIVVPPPVFRPDWETLARLASTPSKPLDLDVCPAPTSLSRFCGVTDKPKPAWFWGSNQETIAVILRPKSPNQSCQFWGPNRETLHHLGFEAKLRNRPTVLRPNREKPSPPVLRSNWRKPSLLVLRPNQWKPSEWFWGQTTHKPSTLVLRLSQETNAPSLHVPSADRTRRHSTYRPPGNRVPNLCDHPWSSASGLLLLPWPSSLHVMPHLPPAHHETSKHDSPNETKIKEKQNKTILDLNSKLAKSMTHHNQTKELTTWFLTFPPPGPACWRPLDT
jgi:hypothetical protein